MCLEGQISKESARRSLARGEAPSGDLIPWTVAQQFQESDFASLSGARIVRVAVHPEMQHMGYGSRAIEQLIHYYQGDMDGGAKPKRPKSSTNTNASRDGNGGEGARGEASRRLGLARPEEVAELLAEPAAVVAVVLA